MSGESINDHPRHGRLRLRPPSAAPVRGVGRGVPLRPRRRAPGHDAAAAHAGHPAAWRPGARGAPVRAQPEPSRAESRRRRCCCRWRASCSRAPDALAPAGARGRGGACRGQLRLAFVSSASPTARCPAWLSGFRALYPDVALSLREATLDVQLELFAAGEIDAGFVLHAPGAVPPGFDHLRVIDEALVMALCCPRAHPAHEGTAGAQVATATGAMPRLRWRDVAGRSRS